MQRMDSTKGINNEIAIVTNDINISPGKLKLTINPHHRSRTLLYILSDSMWNINKPSSG